MNRRYLLLELPEGLSSWQKILPYALLLSITFALYGMTLYFGFVWDDWAYIVKNYRIQNLNWQRLKEIWSHTYLGHYAPVQHSFLAIVYHFFGRSPWWFHLGQVLIHAACVCLVYAVVRKIESPRIAFLATIAFAAHPTNIETVAWISENKSTLAYLFFLLSFWFFIRLRERGRWTDGVFAGLFLILSVLSKINTVVAPAIFLLYDYRQGMTWKKLRWRSLGGFFLISGVFTAVHLNSFHHTSGAMESAYYGGVGVHIMNLPLLLAFYLQMIVFPYSLSAWEMFPAQMQFTWLIALGWAGLASLAFLLIRSDRKTQFWALWIVLFLLPVLQIVPFPIWVADRYLYVPLIGGLVLISQFFFWAADQVRQPGRRWALESVMLILLAVLGWRTAQHVPVWKNDFTLWRATLPTCSMAAYCHMSMGASLIEAGYIDLGIPELIRGVEIRKTPRNWEILGDAYSFAGQDRMALSAYLTSQEGAPMSPTTEIYGKLARVYYSLGSLENAKLAVELGKKINPSDPGLWVADAFVQWKEGNQEQTRRSLNAAFRIIGRNSPSLLTQLLWKPEEVGKMLADLGASNPQ